MAYKKSNPNGQATMANSEPVVIASDQSAVPVSGTFYQATQPVSAASLPLPTGAATSAKQDTGNTSLSSIDGKITACNTGAVVISSGSVTADTELTTADLDTGAGTDTRAVVGIVGSKSGGAQLIPGDATAGLKVDLGADNDVTVTGSVTANAGTNLNTSALNLETTQASIKTSVELIDDAIVADDAAFTPATTKVMMAGFEFDDTTPDSVNEGDAGAARMSGNRNIYTQIRDAAGNERGANVNASNQLSVSVDNTVTVGSHAVTNAGTFAVQESGSALTALQLIDDTVIANDGAAGSAKAFLIGGQYNSSPAKVSASGDLVNLNLTQDGKILDIHSTVAADTTNINNNYSSAQTNTSQQSAPGSNKRIVVVEIIYSRDTAGNMKLVEDPAGTPATKFGPHYFPATGGMVATKVYIPLTANKALGLTSVGGGNETITIRTIIENV